MCAYHKICLPASELQLLNLSDGTQINYLIGFISNDNGTV